MKPLKRRLALLGVLAASALPVLLARGGAQTPFKTHHYKGKVVPLAALLQKQGVKLDQDAAPSWLARTITSGHPTPSSLTGMPSWGWSSPALPVPPSN